MQNGGAGTEKRPIVHVQIALVHIYDDTNILRKVQRFGENTGPLPAEFYPCYIIRNHCQNKARFFS